MQSTISNTIPSTVFESSQDQEILSAQRFHRPGRAILSEDQAREIFLSKPNDSFIPNLKRSRAALLARNFGVTIKTVRDVWIGRTWYRSTYDLDPARPVSYERLQKQPGRPKGAKDTKPRNKRVQTRAVDSEFPPKDKSPSMKKIAEYSAEESIKSLISSSNGEEQTSSVTLEPLSQPPQSRAHDDAIFQDPFHDDWPFWALHSDSSHRIAAGRFSPDPAKS